MMRLSVDRAVIAPSLLFHWFRTVLIRSKIEASVNASNQTSINQQSLNRLPVIIPRLDEQNRLVSLLSCVGKYLEQESDSLDKHRFLKQGLMQDLLAGRVRVKV